jgi:predicted regulator of amino acid metabolism with ACT domain
MYEEFQTLPNEMKCEIKSHLDNVSLIVLRRTLLKNPLPEKLNHSEKLKAISYGLVFVQYCIEQKLLNVSTLVPLAAQAGSLEVLKWARAQKSFGTYPTEKTITLAVMYDHLNIVKYLVESGIQPVQENIKFSRSIEIIKYLLSFQNIHLDRNVFQSAVGTGDLELIKWLLTQNCPYDRNKVVKVIMVKPTWELLKWWEKFENYWTNLGVEHLMKMGRLDILKWLHQKGVPLDSNKLFDMAARHNQKKIIKWLHNLGFSFSNNMTVYAARKNHFNLLKWLHQQGCPFGNYNGFHNHNEVTAAASTGNIQMVKWLIRLGIEVTFVAIIKAAELGHFVLVNWFMFEGYPINRRLIGYLLIHGMYTVAEKLLEQGFRLEKQLQTRILLKSNPTNWKWLLDQGCVFTEDSIGIAARLERRDTLEWLDERCLIFNKSQLTQTIATSGKLNMLIWAIEKGFPFNPTVTLPLVENSSSRGCFATANWIRQKYNL